MKFISSLFGRHKKIRLPLVVKEYQIKGWPLFVGIICDQSLDNLEGVVMQATTFAGQQEISNQDTQAIKDFIEILSDVIMSHYDSIKKGCVEGVAISWCGVKCFTSSLNGDFITDPFYKNEFDSIVGILPNI